MEISLQVGPYIPKDFSTILFPDWGSYNRCGNYKVALTPTGNIFSYTKFGRTFSF